MSRELWAMSLGLCESIGVYAYEELIMCHQKLKAQGSWLLTPTKSAAKSGVCGDG